MLQITPHLKMTGSYLLTLRRRSRRWHPFGLSVLVWRKSATFHDTGIAPQLKDAEGTETQAEETKLWMEEKRPGTNVEIIPVDMEAANDYEEAIRAFSEMLTRLAEKHPDAELIVNTSSGTPAIKLACLLTIAEGRIRAVPHYADDPTETKRDDPVRPINVTFLRESGLMQRTCDLLAIGQFALALEPLSDLEQTAFAPERRRWAGMTKRLADGLRLWDERRYSDGRNRLTKLYREWTDAPTGLRQDLQRQQDTLDALYAATPPEGVRAWDLYFLATRLQAQGHLTAALETFWIAVENVIFERTERRYGANLDDPQFQLRDAVRLLETEGDPHFETLWRSSIDGTTVKQQYHYLRQRRNNTVHRGDAATEGEVHRTRDLAERCISELASPKPVDYPMDLGAIKRMAGRILG